MAAIALLITLALIYRGTLTDVAGVAIVASVTLLARCNYAEVVPTL